MVRRSGGNMRSRFPLWLFFFFLFLSLTIMVRKLSVPPFFFWLIDWWVVCCFFFSTFLLVFSSIFPPSSRAALAIRRGVHRRDKCIFFFFLLLVLGSRFNLTSFFFLFGCCPTWIERNWVPPLWSLVNYLSVLFFSLWFRRTLGAERPIISSVLFFFPLRFFLSGNTSSCFFFFFFSIIFVRDRAGTATAMPSYLAPFFFSFFYSFPPSCIFFSFLLRMAPTVGGNKNDLHFPSGFLFFSSSFFPHSDFFFRFEALATKEKSVRTTLLCPVRRPFFFSFLLGLFLLFFFSTCVTPFGPLEKLDIG